MEQSTMDLKQELADFRAEFERTAPVSRAALYNANVEEASGELPARSGARGRRRGAGLRPARCVGPIGSLVSDAAHPSRGRHILPWRLVSLLEHPVPRLSARPAADRGAGRAACRDLA